MKCFLSISWLCSCISAMGLNSETMNCSPTFSCLREARVRLVQLPVHSTITKRENTGDERHVVRACIKHTQRIYLRVGTSYMIIIMYLNLPIIIVLYITIYPHLYITIHTYTFPYTPIQHHIPLYNTIYPYTKTPIHHHTPLYNTIHPYTSPYTPKHTHTPHTSPYTPLHHHTTLYITIYKIAEIIRVI